MCVKSLTDTQSKTIVFWHYCWKHCCNSNQIKKPLKMCALVTLTYLSQLYFDLGICVAVSLIWGSRCHYIDAYFQSQAGFFCDYYGSLIQLNAGVNNRTWKFISATWIIYVISCNGWPSEIISRNWQYIEFCRKIMENQHHASILKANYNLSVCTFTS